MLCDSNILIYAADPADHHCMSFVIRPDAAITSITRVEVLGFPGWPNLPEDRRIRLTRVVDSMPELRLDELVIQRAIALRRQRRMTLGGAVIAATAIVHQLPLVTRNVDDFRQVTGLTLINPFDES